MTPEREGVKALPGERYGYSDCPVAGDGDPIAFLSCEGRALKAAIYFANANYWTSTENNSSNSWNVNFSNGNTNNNNKTNNRYVRCVRE